MNLFAQPHYNDIDSYYNCVAIASLAISLFMILIACLIIIPNPEVALAIGGIYGIISLARLGYNAYENSGDFSLRTMLGFSTYSPFRL